MLVMIHHQIQDAKQFWEIAEQDHPMPAGLKNIGFYPSADDTAAFCLYEADSLETLRRAVDDGLGGSSVNTYYVVNAEVAVGIPA